MCEERRKTSREKFKPWLLSPLGTSGKLGLSSLDFHYTFISAKRIHDVDIIAISLQNFIKKLMSVKLLFNFAACFFFGKSVTLN